MPIITQTPRLIIRNFQPEEEDAYIALLSDEQVKEHLPKRTPDENRKGFRDTLTADEAGAIFSKWTIEHKPDGGYVGMCLLRNYDNLPDTLEVGYCMHVKYWGQGLATEMVNALITYASAQPEINTIVAVTTHGNIPSQKVLEKAGLVRQDNIIRENEELAFFRVEIK
ncbi:GNAT family N-acetyltransferase [Mucilaginibacter mali]|uniref:GNAT family N-acetyltransferase n=1 Tax=Mucilaginibacter mali TaxID=2740462 RepID=A0A7D4QHX7_9SPHI|nr:GNAT family N-acetyltransferase [Mucilaginibacter mali]QKJ32372.1 GNAT family N-acetyltransferase [Mucilaginibacter mali]